MFVYKVRFSRLGLTARCWVKNNQWASEYVNRKTKNVYLIHALLIFYEQKFTCVVKSKPVKHKVSHTVILPPMLSVLCIKINRSLRGHFSWLSVYVVANHSAEPGSNLEHSIYSLLSQDQKRRRKFINAAI